MRYAIYYTPSAADPLTRRASQWLGRDALSGEPVAQPVVSTVAELADLTAEARRYGFHATMKAPFELAGGTSEAELADSLAAFAAGRERFILPALDLGQLGPFSAFVPRSPCAELQALAADCVTCFDRFRAPLDEKDIARRRPENLSPAQRSNLASWGYPYVLDDFRFHMTLTGPVPAEARPVVRAAIDSHFGALVGAPRPIDALALLTEPARGAPFNLLRMFPLSSTAARKSA